MRASLQTALPLPQGVHTSPPSTHTGPLPRDVLHTFGAGAQILEAQRTGLGREKGVLEQFSPPQTGCQQVLIVLVIVVLGVVVLAHAFGFEAVQAYGSRHSLIRENGLCFTKKRQITQLETWTRDLDRYFFSEEDTQKCSTPLVTRQAQIRDSDPPLCTHQDGYSQKD